MTISKAMNAVTKEDYFVLVIVDGLTKKDMEKMRVDIKNLEVRYSHIKGMKDEQSVFLRLADSMAGLVRDYMEGDKYAKVLFNDLTNRGFLQEI